MTTIDRLQPGPERRDEGQQNRQLRERRPRLAGALDRVVDPAAEVAR